MATSALPRFYANLRTLRRRLLLFVLPSAVAVLIVLGGRLYPEWMSGYLFYMAPVALFALTLFAYALLNASEDLREQQRINRQLAELQAQYGLAEGLAHIGSWVWDQKARRIHMSDGASDVFGLEKAHGPVSQQAFFICVHPEDQKRFQEQHRHALARHERIDLEFRYVKDGSNVVWVRWVGTPDVDEHGDVVRLAGVAQDISERKHSEDQLASERNKYHALTELSADWDWELGPDFRIRKISSQIPAELQDWARDMRGHGFWDLTTIDIPWAGEMQLAQQLANDAREARRQREGTAPARSKKGVAEEPAQIRPEHLQQARQALLQDANAGWRWLQETLMQGRRIRDFEFGVLTKSNKLFTLSLSGQPIFDEVKVEQDGRTLTEKRLVGYRGVGRDVTREAHQNLLLRLESDIVKLIQDNRGQDEAVVLKGVIRLVCETLNWVGGIHIRPASEGSRVCIREKWGMPPVQPMFEGLGDETVLLGNSPEAVVLAQGNELWMRSLTASVAEFSSRYQMEKLGLKAALLAPIKDGSDAKPLSALLFFSAQTFEGNTLVRELAHVLSRLLSQYIQRERLEAQLRRASQHDALTGLPNRKYLSEKLDARLANKTPVAVLYIDLDRYKAINDTLGHQAGDQVLVEVSRRFRDTIGPGNIASRVGGDEFILLLDNQTDPKKVEMIARKVLAAVERPFILQERAHFLSASIGVALSPQHGNDAATLIKCADAAMYTVKSEGRNDVRFYSANLKSARVAQVQLSSEFPSAIERGEVELHYQPVISSFDLQVVGMEGLIRWRHPTQGLLLPDQFLPAAEQSNVMKQLAIWTIRRALQDRQQLDVQRYGNLVVSVNISPNQINEEGFLAQLKGMLEEFRIRPELLRLELTENTLIEASSRTIAQMTVLRKLGVQVMIDNFGTGYASLSYLRNLPVSGLKIDQGFIRGLPDDRGNSAIMQAIMTLAEKLRLQVIAEGVETAQEMQALRELGCRMMQGHFISAAIPPQKVADYLKKRELTGVV